MEALWGSVLNVGDNVGQLSSPTFLAEQNQCRESVPPAAALKKATALKNYAFEAAMPPYLRGPANRSSMSA